METGKQMENFIYVFNSIDKNKLLASGFILLKEDPRNNIYVFISNPNLLFADDIKVMHSNILTF